MTQLADPPALPPGFTWDQPQQSSAASPSLPPGFAWDAPQSPSQKQPTAGAGSDLFASPAVRALMPKLYTTAPNGLIYGNPQFPGVYRRTASGDYQPLGENGQPKGDAVSARDYELGGSQGASGPPARDNRRGAGDDVNDVLSGFVRGFSRRVGNPDVAVQNIDRVFRTNIASGDQNTTAGQTGSFVGQMASPESMGLMAATGGMGRGIAPAGAGLVRRLIGSAVAGGGYTGVSGTGERASQGEMPTLESVVKDIIPGALAGPVGELGGTTSVALSQELPSSIRAISKLGGGASTSAAVNVAASATAAKMQGRPYTVEDAERDAILGVAAHIASGGALRDITGEHAETPNAQPDTPTPAAAAPTEAPLPAGDNANGVQNAQPGQVPSAGVGDERAGAQAPLTAAGETIKQASADLDTMQARADKLLAVRNVPGALESPHGTIEEGEAVEDTGEHAPTAPTEQEHAISSAQREREQIDRYDLSGSGTAPEAISGVRVAETPSESSEASGGAPGAGTAQSSPSESPGGGSISGDADHSDAITKGKAAAERLGMKFLGVDDPAASDPDLAGVAPTMMFQDERSGNFNVPVGGDIDSALTAKRAAFARAGGRGGLGRPRTQEAQDATPVHGDSERADEAGNATEGGEVARGADLQPHASDEHPASEAAEQAREVAPTGEEIGQRGLSSGPPGALQIAPLLKKASTGILGAAKGLIRGLRERFAPIESKYGSDVAKGFIKAAAAPKAEAETLATGFMQRAFSGAPDPAKAAQEWTDLGRFYRLRDLQARLGPTAGQGLPNLPPAEVSRLEADPVMQKATALYNKEVAPLLTDVRTRNNMLMNPGASNPKKFPFFLNLPGENEGPASTDTRLNPSKAFNKPAVGNDQPLMDPKESLAASIRGHLATDYKQQLVKTIKAKYSVPRSSIVPNGRRGFQGTLNGKTVDVVAIDAAPIGAVSPDVQYVPKDIADQFNKIQQERGQHDTLFDKAIQVGTAAATVGDALPHTWRVTAHVGARMAQAGYNPASVLPSWLGSNEAAGARMMQMVHSPMGETLQLLIDRSGSDKGQGYDVQPSQNRVMQLLNKPHDLLFNPEYGVDPMGRRVVADAYLRTLLGNDSMNKMESDLKSGALTPAAASKSIEKALTDGQFVGLGRRVNNTLGFANKQTRSGLLNEGSRLFPFISSESGMIPREVTKLANIDVPGMVSMLQRGSYKQAALSLASSIATGAIGTYFASNALNFANSKLQTGTGQFMWDNDDGHKLDVWIAPGTYLSNLDPTFARGARLVGLKGAANGEDPLASASKELINETLASLANTIKTTFTAASYVASKGKQAYAPYVTFDNQGNPGLLKTSPADSVPLIRNTLKEGSASGAAKDAAALAGFNVRTVNPAQGRGRSRGR